MNIENYREYCLIKTGVSESFPFNDTVLVFKVLDKMFAITDLNDEFKISLKCDPEKAVELRENFLAVKPFRNSDNRHWNTILIDGTISDIIIKEWIDDSYHLVVLNMTKKEQKKLSDLK